jgi:hypothetical protein
MTTPEQLDAVAAALLRDPQVNGWSTEIAEMAGIRETRNE